MQRDTLNIRRSALALPVAGRLTVGAGVVVDGGGLGQVAGVVTGPQAHGHGEHLPQLSRTPGFDRGAKRSRTKIIYFDAMV